MGAQRGKQPAGARHDDCEHMRGYATPRPGQGSRVRHRRLTHEAARTVTTQAGNLADQRRNGRPRPRHRGLPRQTEHAHGGRLVFTRENARDGLGHALDGASSAEPARSISGNRPKPVQGRRFPRRLQGAGARAAPSNWGSERGLALGSGRRGQCATAIPRKSFSSRALRGRNETRRPLISLGYARLKPNPVGQQRLHSTIFPFGPPRIRPRKVSHEKGGRIPRETKSPPSAVLR